MTEKQKKAAIEHLTTLYRVVCFYSDAQNIGTDKYRKAAGYFYSACEMLQVLYGEDVEQELRMAAVLAD